MAHSPHGNRFASAYARFILRRPLAVLLALLALGAASGVAASHLTINSNQLELISQDLPEVKEVKRVIDMVGGAGFFMVALRSSDVDNMKAVADDVAAKLEADKADVRTVTYKMPVEFVQKNMVLFIHTEDLIEAKSRINRFLRDQIRRHNPFFIEIKKTEPVKLDLSDLIAKYDHVGKKSIADDYYLSTHDTDGKRMLMILVKPTWDGNELQKSADFREKVRAMLTDYSAHNPHGVTLVEDYGTRGDSQEIAYGFTGAYVTNVDDSFAIQKSLEPVAKLAFGAILLITLLFFRKIAPSVIVITGMVLGTVITMGFTKVSIGSLNMITSILGAILMGFGVDYGIHFIFRTRIELGAGKKYDEAIHDAFVNAGRPALVSAIVTGGSFMMLLVSQFKGFSQFGFLAGCGTVIIGFTLFTWCAALLALAGRISPALPKRLIGTMVPAPVSSTGKELRIPHPGRVLAVGTLIVAAVCAFAVPWSSNDPQGGMNPGLWQRFKSGIRFNYNTRTLMPADEYSVHLQDEINERFRISSDPMAIRTDTLAQQKELWDEFKNHPEKYSAVDQVVSIYTFVPPPEIAAANAKVLAQWKDELKDIKPEALPADVQDRWKRFIDVLDAKPFDVNGVPAIYADQFKNLPQTKAENRGYLTFLYPGVDLWDGKNMLKFADQIGVIHTDQGHQFRAAGSSTLYARLARMVLADGKLTLLLTTLWILAMHWLDFRNIKLALASVIPLGVGLVMMLGMMSILNQRLNFMNIIILPILLGFGVSHGLYLLHRFLEGTSPVVAFRSVGAAVASSTLTAIAGFGALFVASHLGVRSMGMVACLGLTTTLIVSFTVLAAVLQLMHDARVKAGAVPAERKAA
jgi:predicted RND superfamily exporter protein